MFYLFIFIFIEQCIFYFTQKNPFTLNTLEILNVSWIRLCGRSVLTPDLCRRSAPTPTIFGLQADL